MKSPFESHTRKKYHRFEVGEEAFRLNCSVSGWRRRNASHGVGNFSGGLPIRGQDRPVFPREIVFSRLITNCDRVFTFAIKFTASTNPFAYLLIEHETS